MDKDKSKNALEDRNVFPDISKRNSVHDRLNKYDYLCNNSNDFIEVTEWTNGEGYDVNISTSYKNINMSLSSGEIDALNYLVKTLEIIDK